MAFSPSIRKQAWNWNPAGVAPNFRKIARGCVSLYPFWEPSHNNGGRLLDVAGFGNSGIMTTVGGVGGGQVFESEMAMRTDGDDFFLTGNHSFPRGVSLFADSANKWTVVFRIRITSTSGGAVCAIAGATSSLRQFYVFVFNNFLSTGIRGTATQGHTGAINDGVWRTFSITWDGTTGHVYSLGTVIDSTLDIGTAIEETGEDFTIGARTEGAGFLFNGDISYVAILNYGLTRAEANLLSLEPMGLINEYRQNVIPFVSAGSAALTGTMLDTVDEDDITTGGKTIIITLTGATFKAAGTGPIGSTADTQALIDGFDAAADPTNGWNNEVRDKADPTEVVRTSSTIATWTVAAQAGYDVSSTETITGTIPTDVLVAGGPFTAAPTFEITAVAAGIVVFRRRIEAA